MVAMPAREQSARRWLSIAATLAVLGVLFNLNRDDDTWPKLLAVAAMIGLVWSLHRFGRLGADASLLLEEPEEGPRPKKKKKKKRAAPDAAEGG